MKIEKINSKEYDKFIEDKKVFSQYQYSEFAKVSTDYNEFYKVSENNETIGVFRGRLRNISALNKVPFVDSNEFIIRRSIMLDFEKLNIKVFNDALKKFMNKEKISLFSLSPAEVEHNDGLNIPENKGLIEKFEKEGWNHIRVDSFSDARIMSYEQATPLNYETFEEVEKTFKKDTMRKVRKAKKVGVSIKEISTEELKEYYYLFKQTGDRDNFKIKNDDFYYNLAKQFEGKSTIFLSTINKDKYIDFILENQPKKTDLIELLEKQKESEIPLGLAICIDTDYQTYYHSGATANIFRETMHNYYLHHQAIKYAYDSNKELYNFGGINGSKSKDKPNFALYQFKSRFAPFTLEMCGEFEFFKSNYEKIIFTTLKKIRNK